VKREPTINGNEHDWTTRWRSLLAVFHNRTGLGKAVKRAINKRARRRGKRAAEQGRLDYESHRNARELAKLWEGNE
jgi:hypothetical protein